MSSTKTLKLLIKGRVQGVGYRDWLVAEAIGLGVCGWVRNTDGGGVEALFHGEETACDALIAAAWRGPHFAEVAEIALMNPSEEEMGKIPNNFRRRPTA